MLKWPFAWRPFTRRAAAMDTTNDVSRIKGEPSHSLHAARNVPNQPSTASSEPDDFFTAPPEPASDPTPPRLPIQNTSPTHAHHQNPRHDVVITENPHAHTQSMTAIIYDVADLDDESESSSSPPGGVDLHLPGPNDSDSVTLATLEGRRPLPAYLDDADRVRISNALDDEEVHDLLVEAGTVAKYKRIDARKRWAGMLDILLS